MSSIPIFFVLSTNFTSQTAVAITSIAMNTGSDLNLYFLDCGVTSDEIHALKSVCNKYKNIKSFQVVSANIDDRFNGLNTWRGFIDCWVRFLFPELVHNVDKAIYLDSDVCVMGDIRKIYDQDMAGHPISGAPEIFHEYENYKWLRDQRRQMFGYSEKHLYFGSGVLVFDCKKWRDNNLTDKILQIGREWGEKLDCPDQHALNILFADNYMPISNEMVVTSRDVVSLEQYDTDLFLRMQKNIIVHHFNVYKPFSEKVWLLAEGKLVMCSHLENWWFYAAQTPWVYYFLFRNRVKPVNPVEELAKDNNQKLQQVLENMPGRAQEMKKFQIFNILTLLTIKNIGVGDVRVYLFGFIPIARIRSKTQAVALPESKSKA